MNSPKEKYLLCQLILKFKDETITPGEFELLDKILQESQDNIAFLTQIIELYTQLQRSGEVIQLKADNEILNDKLWQVLANEEKTAQIVKCQLPPSETSNMPIQTATGSRVRRSSLITFILSMAALIFFVLLARYLPAPAGIEVATLTDSMKAKWSDSTGSIAAGSRLVTGYTPLGLEEGFIELCFDNTAKFVIEAPAQFCLLTEDQINLNYGKLYAVVPPKAIGFIINTPNSRIIDLGTEFGVQAGLDGSTELHVIKGKINLLAGTSNKIAMEIRQGFAKLISANTCHVRDVPVNETEFVRSINSKNDTIWRGQKQINLADIVGGGSGLGTGKINRGIDPTTGNPSNERLGTRISPNDYHFVSSNPFIDGVFVPDGRTQQIISSQGHLFRECPATSGSCCENIITSNVRSLDSRVEQNIEVSDSLVHSILLHANMGITFDLQEIRKLLPGVNIVRFQSHFGIRKWALHPSASNADFWVLVDGKIKYTKEQVKIDEPGFVDVNLSEQDRFLTLILTDGSDPEGRILDGIVLQPNDSDWGIFANPVLILN